jgi:long-chain acyl-CoA synthetase
VHPSISDQVGAGELSAGRRSLTEVFYHGVDTHAAHPAVQFKAADRWVPRTHADVEADVAALAATLEELGLRPGDRLAILAENRPEWLVADYAGLCLGAVTSPLYSTLPANQLQPILADNGARIVVVSTAEQLEKVLSVRASLPHIEHVIAIDDPGDAGGVLRWTAVLEGGRRRGEPWRAELRSRALAIDPSNTATLIYTSGTAGTPKGVMLSHGNLAYMVAATHRHGSLPITPGEIGLSLLPLSHVLERAVGYYYWDSGATIAYAESIEKAADNLREVRPHFMVAVPRLFDKIYAKVKSARGVKRKLVDWAERVGGPVADARVGAGPAPAAARAQHALADRLVFAKLRQATGGRIKAFICGGAPLAADVARFFYAAGLPIYEGYGLTETSPVLTANRPGATRFGSVGVPYPAVQVRLDGDNQILARSPGVMQGYWNRPADTAAVISEDGWFRTGDVGEIDPDGFVRITDRIKDLIVTAGGKNIAPQPVEISVTQSPLVSQAVMIGDRRPYPVMLVVPDWAALQAHAQDRGVPLEGSDPAALSERARAIVEREVFERLAQFARYEVPKKLALLQDELSIEAGLLTPTLKVRRRAVEERYRHLVESLYT